MRQTSSFFFILTTPVFFLSLVSYSQDSQSLGDVARQTRQQKQAKGSQDKDRDKQDKGAQASKVITNDEIPEHVSSAAESAGEANRRMSHPVSGIEKMSTEQWKSQIQAQKNMVDSLQKEVDRLNSSIHFVQANLYVNGAQYNHHQTEKQQELERIQTQLEEQKKRLEDMQDTARKQGYGSSVYDP